MDAKSFGTKITDIVVAVRKDFLFWLLIVVVWGSLIWMVGGALLGYNTNPCTQDEPCERPRP